MLASSATPFSVKDILNLSDSGVDELDPQALLYQAQSLEKAFFEEACHEGLLDAALAADALLLPADSAAAVGGQGAAPHLCLPYHAAAACFDAVGLESSYAQHEECSVLPAHPSPHLAQQCAAATRATELLSQQFANDASKPP